MFVQEVKDHLIHKIIPFWEGLRMRNLADITDIKGSIL